MLIKLSVWSYVDQNAGRGHIIKTDISFFERVEEFKYLGTTLTIKILFRKKLKPRNACYHSV